MVGEEDVKAKPKLFEGFEWDKYRLGGLFFWNFLKTDLEWS